MGQALTIIPNLITKSLAHEADRAAADLNVREYRRSEAAEEANAQAALARGNRDAATILARGSAVEGAQLSALAAGGVDSSSGTAADLLASTRLIADLDATTTRNNARAAAFGSRQVARKYRLDRERLASRWEDPQQFGLMSPADTEFNIDLATSALGGAASFGFSGFGGK